MKNLFTNLMKNTAKRTQNTGGGTSHEKNSAVAVWNDGRTTVERRSNDGQSQRRYNVGLWKYAGMILMLLCLGTGEMWATYSYNHSTSVPEWTVNFDSWNGADDASTTTAATVHNPRLYYDSSKSKWNNHSQANDIGFDAGGFYYMYQAGTARQLPTGDALSALCYVVAKAQGTYFKYNNTSTTVSSPATTINGLTTNSSQTTDVAYEFHMPRAGYIRLLIGTDSNGDPTGTANDSWKNVTLSGATTGTVAVTYHASGATYDVKTKTGATTFSTTTYTSAGKKLRSVEFAVNSGTTTMTTNPAKLSNNSGTARKMFIYAVEVYMEEASGGAPSVSSFTPASGAKLKTGATVTVAGSDGSTVYCLWASSAQTATAIKSGTAGTSGAASVTSAGIASANGTTLYAVAVKDATDSDVSSATYTIDDTAPTLSSSTPANGANNIPLSGNIVLTFSENVAINDASKFTISPSAGVTLSTGSATASSNTVTIPYSGLSSATTYTFSSAAGAVTDEAGNTSAALSDIAFTTYRCAVTSCGNADITYAINGGSEGSHSTGGADLISSATPSNTTALGASTTPTYNTISMSDLTKKAAAATSTCYPTKPNMSGKIAMYNGSSYSSSNYLQFTFTVKDGYTFTPCDIQFVVQPVSYEGHFRWEITDGSSSYGYGTGSAGVGSSAGATVLTGLTSTSEMDAGTYYIRLYPYYSGSNTFRIGEDVILRGTTAAAASCTTSPTVTAGSNSSVTATTATVSCASGISSLGSAGCSISSYGFVLNTSTGPTLSNATHEVGTTYTTTDESFEKALTGLTAGTTYYVRPYATNGNGTSYGTETSFTTLPSTPTFSPTSGSTVSGSQKITITGHSGSTVYYAWATSEQSASDIYDSGSGSHGTADAGTASVDVVDGKTLYAISRLSSTNSAVASASYTVDNTAPTLSSSTPADGATDIDASGNITLTFSENVTINDASKFSLTGGSGTLSTGSATASGTTVTIPYSGLDNNTTYTFSSAAGAVKDEAGNTSDELDDIEFTTANVTYTVTYAANGGSGNVPVDGSSPYNVGATVAVLGNVGTPAILTKSGYTFRGWSYNGTFYKAGDTFTISENTTLTAVWDGNGSSVTLTHFGKQTRTSDPRRGFAYAGSLSGTKYIYEVSNSSDNKGTSDSSAMRVNYSHFVKILGPGATTSISDSLFTGVTQVSFKWQLYNATSSTTTNVDVYVGGNKVGSGIELTGTKSDPFALQTISNIASKNGGVKIVNTGTGSSSKHLYFDDITITCGVLPTGKSVTFACGSTEPSTSVSGMPSKIEGVTSGLKIVKPADPSASGYIFGGWYSNAACTSSFSFSGTITKDTTIYAKWTAKTQPTQYTVGGDTYYCPDETAEITLSGSQSGVSYQLKKGGSAQGDAKAGTGEALSWTGMTAGTYTISAVENATYAARDMSGSVTVSAASITAISTQPTTSVSAGTSVNFTLGSDMVTAGHGLSHQWYSYSSSGGADEAAIDGAESATYTTSKSAGTYYYKVKVSGDCGDPVYSSMITVTVKTAPTVYELSGTTSVCEGDEATITLSDSEEGVTYQLYKGGVAEGDPVTGTGSALEWEVTAEGTYTVKAEEDATYAEATMEGSAVISYKTATAISTEPATAVSGHDGVNFTLGSDLDATGQGTLTYQWYSYSNSSGDDETTVGSATTTKTLTTSKSAGTYYYKVKVIGECGDEKSNMITVTVDNKHLLTYDANNGSGAPEAEYRAAGTAALSETEPTRTNYRFLGWNTKDDGTGDHYDAGASYTMGSSAVTLYAEWGETATLTWNLNVNTGESSIGTASKASTNARISNSTDMANLANYGSLTITSSAKASLTSKIETPATYTAGKYMYVTFDVPEDYEFVPTSISVKVQPVGDGEDKYTILDISDENNNLRSTATKCDGTSGGTLTTVTLEGDETALTGTVTLKIYVYNYSGESTTNNCYRLGSPITIAGNVNYVCPERATITSPTTAQSIKLYTDQSKTLSVSATAYAGTLNYQWQKDGVDIDDATSATYTVVGSGLTVGKTYKYTCNVSETSPASCATVTSPAVSITAASPDCGYTEFSSAVLTSSSAADRVNATLLANGLQDISSGSCKLNGKGAYFGLQLASGSFEAGDTIEFKIKKNNSTDIYLFATTDTTGLQTTDAIYTQSVTSGDNIIKFVVTSGSMLTALNTSKKVAVVRRTKDGVLNQNHSVYYVKVKRYGCPDIVVFDDAKGNGKWSDEDNWIGTTGHGATPTIEDRIVINKPMTVDVTNAKAKEIILDQSSGNEGKLTITAGNALLIAETLAKTTDGETKVATEAADVIINSTRETGVGALIIGGETGTNAATMNFETKAKNDGGWVNQFVGSPFSNNTPYVDYALQLYKFVPQANGDRGWWQTHTSGTMTPFWGYNVLYNDNNYLDVTWTGTLNASESKMISGLYYNGSSETDNMFANSWTAPIHVGAIEDADLVNASKTLYMFNAGTPAQEEGHNGSNAANNNTEPGTYISIPIHTATYAGIGVIPSMQAFYVLATGSGASITLDYNKVVYTPALTSVGIVPNRAPRRSVAADEPEVIKLRVQSESGWAANTYVMGRADFAESYEDGWDGAYIEGESATPKLYTPSIDGNMFINCLPEIEGTVVGFRKGSVDNYYTCSFEYNGEDTWYLNDLKEQKSTLINAAETYEFVAEPGDTETRFVISATPIHKITTGNESVGAEAAKVRKLIIDDKVYIIRGGRMYSVDGQMIK